MSDDIAKMSFEDAMAALEAVVGQLERGEVALEQSLILYDRGAGARARAILGPRRRRG